MELFGGKELNLRSESNLPMRKFCLTIRRLIDRESFLSFYFVLAIFCAGVGTLLGTDDLLVAFAAGCAFAWEFDPLSTILTC